MSTTADNRFYREKQPDAAFTDQISAMVAENRRLRNKSDADDKTIHVLKAQYDAVTGGIENMIEDHRKIERDLTIQLHKAQAAYQEIDGLLHQASDLILQAARARVGNGTPEKMPTAAVPAIEDGRLPAPVLS